MDTVTTIIIIHGDITGLNTTVITGVPTLTTISTILTDLVTATTEITAVVIMAMLADRFTPIRITGPDLIVKPRMCEPVLIRELQAAV